MNSTLTNPSLCKDCDLVSRAVAGDQQAYAALMKRYQKSVYHSMYRMVHDREDARDLTAEAFGKAFLNLKSYVPRYAFSTWLFRIATNNGIDFLRRKRMSICSLDEPLNAESDNNYTEYLQAKTYTPEEVMMRQQKRQYVRQAVGQLSHKYQLMIELRYFEERSYEEIANELDLPLGTVKAQLYRARRNLSHMMQKPAARAHHEYRIATAV